MRRTVGGLLVVLGALLVGVGFLANPYLYERLATVPLDQDSTSVSEGTGMSVLWPHLDDQGEAVIEQLDGVRVLSTRRIVGIPGVVEDYDLTDSTAFWQTTVKSQAETNGEIVDLSYSDEGVSVDRVSGAATNCCGDYRSIGDLTDSKATEPVTHEGQFFKFPFDVQKRTYDWWDGAIGRAEPIEFVEEGELFGTPVYVFRQEIPEQIVGTVDVPLSAFGSTEPGNTSADASYSNTRTLWVEPVTGVLIKGEEEVRSLLVAQGFDPLERTVGTIGFNEDTVRANADEWGGTASLLKFVRDLLRPVGLVLGLVLVVLGILLMFRREPNRPAPAVADVSLDEIRTSRSSQ
ncbi:MAG: DUF3068 domain-containing protein [Phycicoccus sp.]